MQPRVTVTAVNGMEKIKHSITSLREPVPEILVPAAPEHPSIPPKNCLLVRAGGIVGIGEVKLEGHEFPLHHWLTVLIECRFVLRTHFWHFGYHLIHHVEDITRLRGKI